MLSSNKVYSNRKYDGDDAYSWAVFRKIDLKGLGAGVVFYGQAWPIVSGCSKTEAQHHRQVLEMRAAGGVSTYLQGW